MLALEIVQLLYAEESHLLQCDFGPVDLAFSAENVHFLYLFGFAKRAFFLPDDPLIKTRNVVRMPAFRGGIARVVQANRALRVSFHEVVQLLAWFDL